MSDRRTTSPDPGYVPFRAAAALGREGAAPADEGGPRKAPPLPPPPPGAPAHEAARPATVPAPPVRRASPRPPPPAPGAGPEAIWRALVEWCVEAGVAEGGIAAIRGGSVIAVAGDAGAATPDATARSLSAALEAAGADAPAVAVDAGGRWVTGFLVPVPGGEVLLCLRGKAAVRADLRGALAAWALGALHGA